MSAVQGTRLHIRPGMDVYSAYQDRFLGSVIRVWHRGLADRESTTPDDDTSTEKAQSSAPMVHEEGDVVGSAEHHGTRQLGEEMGPVPTIAAGNWGPLNQSAGHHYGTARDDPEATVYLFAVRPGRLNLGPLTRPFYVPISAVRSLSMERIVVEAEGQTIPQSWHTRATLG